MIFQLVFSSNTNPEQQKIVAASYYSGMVWTGKRKRRIEIYCTCKADIPSKQFNAMLALPGNVSGLARRNKMAMEDTVVVPCNKNN